jgi:hypothetical protein
MGADFDSEDFNRFDGALCEAAEAAPLVDLRFDAGVVVAGLPAAAVRVFLARGVSEAVLDDFLRVSLDIRLPFDAFGGSTKQLLQLVSAGRHRAHDRASLTAQNYGYKDFRSSPACSLNARPGRYDVRQE